WRVELRQDRLPALHSRRKGEAVGADVVAQQGNKRCLVGGGKFVSHVGIMLPRQRDSESAASKSRNRCANVHDKMGALGSFADTTKRTTFWPEQGNFEGTFHAEDRMRAS